MYPSNLPVAFLFCASEPAIAEDAASQIMQKPGYFRLTLTGDSKKSNQNSRFFLNTIPAWADFLLIGLTKSPDTQQIPGSKDHNWRNFDE